MTVSKRELLAAILRGFPPARQVSNHVCITVPSEEGEATVIDIRDSHQAGRVRLDFGSWAHPSGIEGEFNIKKGDKVRWYAYKGSSIIRYIPL